MADTTLNRFLASGTAAQRGAFTPTPPSPASGPASGYVWFETDTKKLWSWNAGASAWQEVNAGTTRTITYTIDGGGSAITTGMKGYLPVEFSGTITANVILADQSGSIVVNIWKCTYAQFDAGSTHPVVGDKITSATPPTISSATKNTDSTLSGWTTSITAGDILAFNVDSVATVQRVVVALTVSAP